MPPGARSANGDGPHPSGDRASPWKGVVVGFHQVGETIVWRMHFVSAPERVFAALSTDEGRERFWVESSRQSGSEIAMRFVNGYECVTRVLESTSPSLLRLSYLGGTSCFELKSDGKGGSDLTLSHDSSSLEYWHEEHAGWLNVLFPLKAWVDHGIDLRNHDPGRTWDEGYADQ